VFCQAQDESAKAQRRTDWGKTKSRIRSKRSNRTEISLNAWSEKAQKTQQL